MSDPITPLTPADEVADAQAVEHERYIHKALVGLDIFLNILSGGQEDMTISSRASLAAQHGSPIGKALSSFLNLFEKDHGLKAEIGDEVRAQQLQSALGQNISNETK